MTGWRSAMARTGTGDAARRAVKTALRRARRRWFLAEWARIGTSASLLVALALAGSGVAGVSAALSRDGLAAVLVLALSLAVVLTAAIAWPLGRRPSDTRVARYVEERCPELEDGLASAADILAHGERTQFAALVVRDAATKVGVLDLDRVVSRSVLGRRFAALAGGTVVATLCGWWALGPLRPAFDALILRFAPSLVTIDVEPGSVSVAEGEPLVIRAHVGGLLAFDGPVSLVTHDGQAERQVEMVAGARSFSHELDSVDRDVAYRVQAASVSTPEFHLKVRRAPRVARIDVQYDYPAFTGLPPRVQEDSGDIYAPAGSTARVTIHTTHPATGGVVRFASGEDVALHGASTRFDVPLRVDEDGSYRLILRDSAGTEVADATEYFIRVLDDSPPEVRIVRPAGDRRVTPLEELVVEVRADDDHGVDRLELVYAAAGRPERVVALHPGGAPTSVSGSGTVYVEDLEVEPGDFITFYARARDVARGRRPTEVQSDIFFLEVRPFSEEFQLAQTQAFQGAGGNVDDLAARQKEIVIATWKVERRAVAGRSPADIAAIARAQRELRDRALRSAESLAGLRPARRRGGEPRPEEAPQPGADDPTQRATAAMEVAAIELDRARPAQALPHEREALAWLLKARADVRRRQVARQQSGSGGRGATGSEDLSALFDRELMRQQETNYESRSSLETRSASKESEALSRLRELARRQDDLARRQQELARQASRMSQAEVRRQLERLTREQEELERTLRTAIERPQADTRSSGGGRQGGEQSAVDAAREAMRDANRSLQSGNVDEAARAAERARQQLSNAARNLDDAGREGSRAMDLGQLQLEARETAEAARRLAGRLGARGGRATGEQDAQGTQESVATRQDQLASRIDRLEAATADAASRRGAERELRQAAGDLGRQQLGDRLRREASALRRAGSEGREAAHRGAEETRAVASALETLAERLSRAGGLDAQARRLSDDLARTRATRDRLEQLAQQIDQESRRGSAGDRTGSRPDMQPRQQDRAGRDAGPNGRSGDAGEADRLSREFAREARRSSDLMDALREQGPELAEGLAALEGTGFSRSAPGTEAFKQDFATWDLLRQDVLLSLERLEASLAGRLAERTERGRVAAGRDDRTTDEYRFHVDRYFRAIARSPRR